MEPIISPWLIYAINVVHNVTGIVIFMLVLSVIGIVLFGFSYSVNDSEYSETERKNRRFAAKWLKRSFVFLAVAVTIGTFIPSKETMVAMLISSYVTPDNVQAVQGNIVDFVGKLTEAVSQNIK